MRFKTTTRFEKTLRRLAPGLEEREVPSELHTRTLAHLPERHSLQKVGFDMKILVLPIFLLVSAASGLIATRLIAPQLPTSTLLRVPRAPTATVRLHFVDAAGRAIPQATVTLWGYEAPKKPGDAPPALVLGSPNRAEARSDAHGDVLVTNGHLSYFSASAAALPLHASGEITVREGEQVVTLTEHPVHTVTGQCVDEQGNPVNIQPKLYQGAQPVQALQTDPEGRFIAWLVPGTDYSLVFARTGPGNPIEMRNARVEQGKFLDLGTITIRSAQ